MTTRREDQLAYSELQAKMLDERKRVQKAAKIIAVVRHALGKDDLAGVSAVDVGCSAGFIAHELALAGADVVGVDIDEPGITRAKARFGTQVDFRLARGDALPLEDDSVDVVVLNHIYEHVVDPDAVVAETRRVLRPGGLAYLGLGNRLGVMEPHYELPFLSWLPKPVAHRYVRLAKKGDEYYETFRTRPGLRKLFGTLDLWDYTIPVLTDPQAFASEDMVPGWMARVPAPVLVAALPLVPTYIWIGYKGVGEPVGSWGREAPRHLARG